MDEADLGLRNATYGLVAELGRVPTAQEVAQATGLGLEDVRARGRAPGATIPVAQLALLAFTWWGDRLSPGWRPHTREQNQAILDAAGLTGDFWRLPYGSFPSALLGTANGLPLP